MSAFRDPIAWEDTLPIRPSSPAWRATVRGIYGTLEDPAEIALFRELSGGREPPAGGADEFLSVAGRRGGKSETVARLATFEAIHGGHQVALAPGQLGLIVVILPLREQGQEIMGYVRGLAALPAVKRHVLGEPTRDGVTFKNGIAIRIMTADAVAVSGPTVVVRIYDEWGKFPGEGSAMSERMIDDALRPALAPVVGAARRRSFAITSAHITEGLAFETDRDHFGKPDAPVLVVRGTTEQFNPNIDRAWLERERERVGGAVFDREYRGVWMAGVLDGYLPESLIGPRFQSMPEGYVYGRNAIVGIDPSKMRKDRDATGYVIAVWCQPSREPRYQMVQGAGGVEAELRDERGYRIELPRPTRPILRLVEAGEFDHASGFTLPDAAAEIARRGKRWGATVIASDDYESNAIIGPCTKNGIRRVIPYRWDQRSKTEALGTLKRMCRESTFSSTPCATLLKEAIGLRCKITRSGNLDFETHGLDVLSALISVMHYLNDPDGINANEYRATPLDGDPRRAMSGQKHVVSPGDRPSALNR